MHFSNNCMHAPYTVRVMKSLRNILDVPLAVGYVSVEFSIFWVFSLPEMRILCGTVPVWL